MALESNPWPASYRNTLTYDGDGRNTEILDTRGYRITTVYTARNEVSVLVNELGYRQTYTYDPDGRTATRRFASGDLTTYTHDNAGREIGRLYADGTRATLQHDALGNRTTMIDPTGTTTYGYDPLGRPSGKTGARSLVQAYSTADVPTCHTMRPTARPNGLPSMHRRVRRGCPRSGITAKLLDDDLALVHPHSARERDVACLLRDERHDDLGAVRHGFLDVQRLENDVADRVPA